MLSLDVDMIEVTRLTRAGRISEATALLQRRFAPGPSGGPGAAAADHAGPMLDLTRRPDAPIWDWAPLETRPRQTPSPTPSPTPAPKPARFTAHQIRNAAGRLSYKLFVPSRAGSAPMPLVVMLHGCTQSADDFAAGTRMNALAETHGFLVAYPEQAQAANAQRCWNWFKAGDQVRDRGEPSLIADVTRAVIAGHAVDPARVFVAGLSAGGAAAAILGRAYPDLYAGVGVHSGLACGAARDMPSAFAAMRGGASGTGGTSGVPIIIVHGTADRTVNPANATAVAEQSSARTAPETTERGRTPDRVSYTKRVRRDAGGRVLIEQWMIDGVGHAWSGGSPAGSYTAPHGPDASREMLRFFGILGDPA